MIVKESPTIASLTTFKNTCRVPSILLAECIEDIQQYVRQTPAFSVLGRGSNTLLSPDFSVPILQLSGHLSLPSVQGSRLTVGAATTVNKLMAMLQEFQLSGLEFSAGVPASVGGMVAMNFGCWNQSISDKLTRARIVDQAGVDRWVSNHELEFGYRSSAVQTHGWIVVEAEFELTPTPKETIKETILTTIALRCEKQPLKAKTFGSIFKNPPNNFAARLIESAGFKGYRLGNVAISEKHANFMVNLGDGTFKDAIDLIHQIEAKVAAQTGFQLEREVKVLG